MKSPRFTCAAGSLRMIQPFPSVICRPYVPSYRAAVVTLKFAGTFGGLMGDLYALRLPLSKPSSDDFGEYVPPSDPNAAARSAVCAGPDPREPAPTSVLN